MRKLLVVLSLLASVAGCAGTGMSTPPNWDENSHMGSGSD